MQNKENMIITYNAEIKMQLADAGVQRALLTTTFKGLDETQMRQALLEGLIRGFTFQNFLKKDIYALPFGKTYSLITSIDYARKIAQKAGQCGKKEPVYVFAENGKDIITCSVTVQKLVGNYVGDYTATVYFNEYDKKSNLWISKPKTMIAKVAEMHALRSAFPEELEKLYVEEELGKASRVNEVLEVDKTGLNMSNITKPNGKEKAKANESEDKDGKVSGADSNTDNEDKGN